MKKNKKQIEVEKLRKPCSCGASLTWRILTSDRTIIEHCGACGVIVVEVDGETIRRSTVAGDQLSGLLEIRANLLGIFEAVDDAKFENDLQHPK